MRCEVCHHASVPSGRGHSLIVAVRGPAGSVSVEVSNHPVTAGRGRLNRIHLDDPGVSGVHARLFADSGQLHFQDLGSRNGCRLGTRLLLEGLLDGTEELQIGPFSLGLKPSPLGEEPVSAPSRERTQLGRAPSPASADRAGTIQKPSRSQLQLLSLTPALPAGSSESNPVSHLLAFSASFRTWRQKLIAGGARILPGTPPSIVACWTEEEADSALECCQSILLDNSFSPAPSLALWIGEGELWNFGGPREECLAPMAEARRAIGELSAKGRTPGQLLIGGPASQPSRVCPGELSMTERAGQDGGTVRIVTRRSPARAADRPFIRTVSVQSATGRARGFLALLERRGATLAGQLALEVREQALAHPARLAVENGPAELEMSILAARQIDLKGTPWVIADVLLAGDISSLCALGGDSPPEGNREDCPVCFAQYDVSGATPGATVFCGECSATFVARSDALPPEALAPVASSRPAAPGATEPYPEFPGYQVIRKLGEGGMGTVFEALDRSDGRRLALKTMLAEWSSIPAALARFSREANLLKTLQHPGIVQVYGTGVTAAGAFLAMEFVDGMPLDALLQVRRLEPGEALHVILFVSDALAYCHGQGVLHRDIKPPNVLLTRSGDVKLADFGLASILDPSGERLTQTNMRLGTPHYMAPEQALDAKRADARADIYSMGIMLYELLTARLPLEGRFKLPSELCPGLPRELDAILLRAIESDRDERWPDVAEFQQALGRLVRESKLPLSPPKLPQ